MGLDRRSTAVLNEVLDAIGYVSISHLTKVFNVSRRTIYNDLRRINDWLSSQGFPVIDHVRSSGLYLDQEIKDRVKEEQKLSKLVYYEFSPDERRAVILMYLLTTKERPLFLADFGELLEVSRNTVLDDIKKLKTELISFHLSLNSDQLKGYVLDGLEFNKRQSLIYYLSHLIPELSRNEWVTAWLFQPNRPHNLVSEKRMVFIRSLLSSFETKAGVEFTDDILFQLSIRFALFIQRMEFGQMVELDEVEKQVIQSTSEYEHTRNLCAALETEYTFQIIEDEVAYLTAHLLSSRVNYMDMHQRNNIAEIRMLQEAIHYMVEDFEHHALIEIDDKQGLENNLLLHLKPAFYRITYGIGVENHLADTVKQHYPEIYNLTGMVVHHFERLVNKKITKNEIAYIAMHFGGWLRNKGISPEIRKRMLIVCSTGIGTSRLLENQLDGLFTDIDIVGVASLREYERMELDVDIIVSTLPLSDNGVPVLLVNPILTNEDKERLLNEVSNIFGTPSQNNHSVVALLNIVKHHATIHEEQALERELKQYLHQPSFYISDRELTLSEVLPERRITFLPSVTDWKSAIREAAKSLKEEGHITDGYIEAMIQMVKDNGPYIVISPKIAIPHANPIDGVNALGMSLLSLDEPVWFQGKEVEVIIVLATIDDHAHLRSLSQLTSLFSDKQSKKQLLAARDPKEIQHILQQYS